MLQFGTLVDWMNIGDAFFIFKIFIFGFLGPFLP